MSLTAKDKGSGGEPCPAGNHIARCIQVIDLGTQVVPYQDGPKEVYQVRITWELPKETKVFREENGPEPYVLSQKYTLSLHKKSNLRRDLESWRGRAFSEQELSGFDLRNILDKPCLLSVIHREKNGNTYANIGAISAVPKGMECPPRVNDLLSFDLETRDMAVFARLPEFIQNAVKASLEWSRQDHPSHVPVESLDDSSMPF